MHKITFILIGLSIFIASCRNKKEEAPHEHGPEPLAYTVYSDKSEIFVEFKPLVVGSASKFAAHFTVLGEYFTPLSEGSVTVSLLVGDKGIRQKSDTPGVPGIYRLSLTPKVAGTGKLIFDIVTKSFTDQIIIDNIQVYANEAEAIKNNSSSDEGNSITYLKEQAWKVPFANTPVRNQPYGEILKTSGLLLSAPGDEQMVTANANGIVFFDGNSSVIGSAVTEKTKLFLVSGGGLAQGNVDAQFKELKATYEKSKTDYEREAILVKDKIVSLKDFQETTVKYENAKTAYETMAKNYTSGGYAVMAGMNGYLKDIFVSEGQYVTAGTPLATVSKNKKLLLQANISQKYFSSLPKVASATFKLSGSGEVYSTEHLNGKKMAYGKSATTNTPFIPVTFEIDNIGELVSGSIVEVFLKCKPVENALVIPASSIMEEQGNYYVYVQTGGESFEKREVKTGTSDGIDIQIFSGLVAGERVVNQGAYQIKLSQASGTMPAHGHEH